MNKNRLEAFSDGVFAIIITIMVLEIKVPHGESFASLIPLLPVFLSYILSFVYVGIYWNNHHHLLQAVQKVSGGALWANLHLLFWLSLLPFATGWVGENHLAAAPMVVYGIVLMMAAIAWVILQQQLLKVNESSSVLASILKDNPLKERLSPALYIIGIASAFWLPLVAAGFYILTAIIWLIPDKRIEKKMAGK